MITTERSSEETQLNTLRLLIAETQGSSPRFARELTTFAEAFSETCGHNRLEQIGLRWSAVLTPAQTRVLVTDSRAANAFAAQLHRALMQHLLPDEEELATLPKASVLQWSMSLRMGIQGVLRRRAYLSGEATGSANFAVPTETFLQALQPVIRQAADEFFAALPEIRERERVA